MKQRWTTIVLGLATAALAFWAPAQAKADEPCALTDLTCVTQGVGTTVGDTLGDVGQAGNGASGTVGTVGNGAVGTVRDTVTGAVGTVRNIVDGTLPPGTGGGVIDPTDGGGPGGGVTGTGGGTGTTTGGSVTGHVGGTSVRAGASTATDPSLAPTGGTATDDAALAIDRDRHAASRASIGHIAAEVAAGALTLLLLGGLMFGFLLVQDRLDARDPRMASTSHASDRVAFG